MSRTNKKENFIKNQKKCIINGFYFGFIKINKELKTTGRKFFSTPVTKGDVVDKTSDLLINYKEKLYNILIYSEIPEKDAKTLTEKSFAAKDFSVIICHYKQILEELNSIESSV